MDPLVRMQDATRSANLDDPASTREKRAYYILEHPDSYPGLVTWPELDIKLRVWQHPAFGPYSVWALRHSSEQFWVRRVEWDRAADVKQAVSEPTTYGCDATLPTADVKSLIDRLERINLPPFLPATSFGLDGVVFGVAFGDYRRSARLSWWSYAPQEWQPLVEWFNEAVGLFDRYLPVGTSKMHP